MRTNLLILLSTITYISNPCFADQDSNLLLKKADSLFFNNLYTQSFSIYEKIYQEHHLWSKGMFLKMAFIKESLGDYTHALYYLSLLNKYYPSSNNLKKMEELAEKYKLDGYEYNDYEYFKLVYYQYHSIIVIGLLILGIVPIILLINKKRLRQKLGLMRPLLSCFVLFIVFITINYNIAPGKGIIKKKAPLMYDASSGSDFITTIEQGHQVILLDKVDVWQRILWKGDILFIKESNVLPID